MVKIEIKISQKNKCLFATAKFQCNYKAINNKDAKKICAQINWSISEKEEITTEATEIHGIMKINMKKSIKLQDLPEMDRFLETCNLKKLNEEEVES